MAGKPLTIRFKPLVSFTTDAAENPVARTSNPTNSQAQAQAHHVDWMADELEEDERAYDPLADLPSSEDDIPPHAVSYPIRQLAIKEPIPTVTQPATQSPVLYNVFINICAVQYPDNASAQAPRGRGSGMKAQKKATNSKSDNPTTAVIDTLGPAVVDINSDFSEFVSSLAGITEGPTALSFHQ